MICFTLHTLCHLKSNYLLLFSNLMPLCLLSCTNSGLPGQLVKAKHEWMKRE